MSDDDYNDTNRAFMQAFIGRSTLTFAEAKPILAAIFSVHRMNPPHLDPHLGLNPNPRLNLTNQS